MMRYGIPTYRLPRTVLDAEIDRLRALGVVIEQGHRVEDLGAEMREGPFDAVFVAVGAHLSTRIDIPNQDASRVMDAVDFLRGAASGTQAPLAGRVAVYGGGNTAMDAARVARRMGADDTVIVYRRTREQMPAHESEAQDAEEEGIRINWLRTISSMGEADLTVEIQELDESGRPHGTGRFETLEADTVILALGQASDTGFLQDIPGIEFQGDTVQVAKDTLMTGAPGIFAGGDAVPSQRTVTVGVGHGKRAARAIDAWLRGERRPARAQARAREPRPAQPLVLRGARPARGGRARSRDPGADLRRGADRAVADRGGLRGRPVPVVRQLLRVRRLPRRLPGGCRHQARRGAALRVRRRQVHGLRCLLPAVPRPCHRDDPGGLNRCASRSTATRRRSTSPTASTSSARSTRSRPSSTMAELADEWASHGRTNVWGTVPTVMEMQSEGGAAGAMHGALQGGALSTTFTASQGLLLMIPNMYKIAGELTSTVFHVAARSLAAQGLSIFGDHSDVMAVRQTGFALLSSASVQEAHDLALVAQAATLRTRVPFVHFFDGFRTSHELNTVELIDDDVLRAVVPEHLVREHRARALTPEHPFVRGTAQNPDVYFQARETVNPFYARTAAVVQDVMDEVAAHTGRAYRVAEYSGHPEAERVVVIMGSGGETVRETVAHLVGAGERVGVLQLRLYRPFPSSEVLEALPGSVRQVAVLDRTKEPGSNGEPLYLDVLATLAEAHSRGDRETIPRVIGGRYGLSSKEFTPGMVAGIFDELALEQPRRRFTLGITDDVGDTSLPYDPDLDIEDPQTLRAVFYGLGADGTVGANKNTIKILGADPEVHAQAYFVYDSKKSGGLTVSHLRFGPHPIHAPYLVSRAGFVGCHHLGLLDTVDVLACAQDGATLLLNAPQPPEEVWDAIPGPVQQEIIDKRLRLYAVDATVRGPGRRTARPHQHGAADLLLRDLGRAAGR